MKNVARLTKPLIILFALTLTAAACGSDGGGEIVLDDDADAPTGEDADGENADGEGTESTLPPADPDPEEDADGESDGETGEDAGSGLTGEFLVTEASPDLISPQPASIIEVVTVDEQTIGVRYQNGSEPCALANVTVTESDTEIVVELVTGLHPNAAAMSCIAQVVDYEIQVTLDAPVGDRQIVA